MPVSTSEQFLGPEIVELFERRTRKILAYPQEEHVIPVRNEPQQAKARYSIWMSVIINEFSTFDSKNRPFTRQLPL